MEICIFLTALYLVIEDLRTKTVNVYVCILLFLLSTIYAIYFNVNGYLDNLLAGMLFLTFMYTSTMKLKKADYVLTKTEYTPVENISEGLPYLPFIFSGFVLYMLLDLENNFAVFIRNVQISVDFLAVPLCTCLCLVIFIQVIRYHLNKDKIVIFITHRMAHCKESQLTFVMKEGRLIQQGSYDELFNQANLFRELVENQKNLERIIENER